MNLSITVLRVIIKSTCFPYSWYTHEVKRIIKLVVITTGVLSAIGCFFLVPDRLNGFEEIPEITGPAVPVELTIDRVQIRAPIEPVGTVNGFMAVPLFANSVGWYDLGTRPGDTGSAVLAGHVNWTGGQDAVFTNLHLLQTGDIISVMDNYGNHDHFIVRDIKKYALDAPSDSVFRNHDGLSRLNLITCDGKWDSSKGTHDSRLVVFTEKI